MSRLRSVQNFSHRRAVVVSSDRRATEALFPTLLKLGLAVEHLPIGEDELVATPEDLDPSRDVLFVDGDLHRPLNLSLSVIGDMPPVPVIGIVGMEAPSRLRALIQIGATAFLSKPVYGGAVFSALYLAVNEYGRKSELRMAVEELETRRRQRRYVIKAVTALMQARNVDDEAAFALLRRESMRARLSVESYSEYVVQRSATEQERDCGPQPRQAIAD